MTGIHIHPSILSADFARLADEIARVQNSDAIHVDVMDNHFVPNLTMGTPVVQAIRAATDKPLGIHLMIEDADRWAPDYADLGAESVTFHVEASKAPIRLAGKCGARGTKAWMPRKPATPIEPYMDMLTELDMILLMTVEPGFGGQSFLDVVLPKIRRARQAIEDAGVPIALQVDGGVAPDTIERAAEAGADVFVAGSAVYSADDPAKAIDELRTLARNAQH